MTRWTGYTSYIVYTSLDSLRSLQAGFGSVSLLPALNGSLVGYCEGRKGLRPGDPISLYLFAIVMEVFAKLLEEVALRSEFEFNPKCDVRYQTDALVLCS